MPAAVRGPAPGKPRGKGPSPTTPAAAKSTAPHGGLQPRQVLAAAAGVLALALALTLAVGGRAAELAGSVGDAIDGRFGDAGFRLSTVHVQGASVMATPDIVAAAGVYRDQPLLGLDLEAVRQQVEAVGWVQEAQVVRLLPDTLVIAVTERRQLAVWQNGGVSRVIDDKGKVIPEADPARFPGLPLVVGQGGAEHASGILPVLAQRPRLMERMDALVRVDDRRWDLRLKDGSLIQLPAVGEEEALIQLEQLDQRSRILELGFERIDLRNPDVVAVRPRQSTAPGQILAGGA